MHEFPSTDILKMMSGDTTDLENEIAAIHRSESRCKLVIAMAGSGTQAISELMRYGNGSATLLAQHLLYDNAAFDFHISGKPDKYVSATASRQLAMAAYMESRTLSRDAYPTAGIGCTSSLVKPDGEREGREHLICVSVQDALHTRTMTVALDGSLHRTRTAEEWINALAILRAIAESRGAAAAAVAAIGDRLQLSLASAEHVELQTNAVTDEALSEVLHGKRSLHALAGTLPSEPVVVCAGSFNPLHLAHVKLLRLAERETGLPGVFELSITNVDKAPLDFLEIEKRVQPFAEQSLRLVVTNCSKFIGKMGVFPRGSAFVMGSDTFARVVDGRYYDRGESPLEYFEQNRVRFVVGARRRSDGSILTGEEVIRRTDDPGRWEKLVTCIAVGEFLMDVSSTDIATAGRLKTAAHPNVPSCSIGAPQMFHCVPFF